MSISSGEVGAPSRAGATAAPPGVVAKEGAGPGGLGICGSGSRMSAPSPRPSAFLGIDDYLLGELRIALGPFTMNIVENDRFTETWSFRQTNIARNDALKYLRTKKASQVRRNLAR